MDDTPAQEVTRTPQSRLWRSPWFRHLTVIGAVGAVITTAFAYPPAAMPLGLGLAALQLLRRNE